MIDEGVHNSYKLSLPHWLRMALDRMAQHAIDTLDNSEHFPCLKRPQSEFPDDYGCRPTDPDYCMNCERAAGIHSAANWVLNGMQKEIKPTPMDY